jgi:putative hydrolase of the HAD superfamily
MTFLFDIGNVLLKLHFERFHETILGAPDVPLPDDLLILRDSHEIGAITCDDFVTRSLKVLETNLTPESFTRAWEDIFSLNEPMWGVVRHLKESGHRLILFSNTNAIHTRHFLATYPDFGLFDHHHFSQEIGASKPHDSFYQKALDHYNLIPSETLYLDDLPENIATGKRFDFQSWQYDFENHEACLDWLLKQGITLPATS